MDKMKKIFIYLEMFIFLISLIDASITIGKDDSSLPKVTIPHEIITFLNTSGGVNRSDFWDSYDIPSDIPESKFWYNQTQATGWIKSGTNVFLETSTDKVGIGTNSPTYNLDIHDSTTTALRLIDTSTNDYTYIDSRGVLDLARQSGANYLRGRVTAIPLYIGLTTTANGLSYPLRFYDTSVVINEEGYDYDFRAEGSTDTGLFFLDAGNNRIGIGTTTPTYKLEVSDTTTNSLNVANTLYVDGSNNKVGIGTSNPSELLHISGAGNPNLKIESTDTNDAVIRLNSTTSEWTIFSEGTGQDFIIRDVDAGANRLTIDSSGQVGIGTTPTHNLDVYGGSSGADFAVTRYGAGGQEIIVSASGSEGDGNIINAYGGKDFRIKSNTNPLELWTNGAERIHISDNGNVGIGTSADTYKLEVAGSLKVDSGIMSNTSLNNYQFGYRASTSADYYSVAIGRQAESSTRGGIAIGYASKAKEVKGASNYNVALGYIAESGGGGSLALGYLPKAYGNQSVAIGRCEVDGTFSACLNLDNTARTITDDNVFSIGGGNVGIGTTSPSTTLDVNGVITATTLDTGQGANELYDMNQNVLTTSAVTFATINTGHGNNELYGMNQDVLTGSSPTFIDLTLNGDDLIFTSATDTSKINLDGTNKFSIGYGNDYNHKDVVNNAEYFTCDDASSVNGFIWGTDSGNGLMSLSCQSTPANSGLDIEGHLSVNEGGIRVGDSASKPKGIISASQNISADVRLVQNGCQAGFTRTGNGCIETAEEGTGTQISALDTCYSNYGGRLPTAQEFISAMRNYVLTDETDDDEWLGDSGASYNCIIWQYSVTPVQDFTQIVSESCALTEAYRCFIPFGGGKTV